MPASAVARRTPTTSGRSGKRAGASGEVGAGLAIEAPDGRGKAAEFCLVASIFATVRTSGRRGRRRGLATTGLGDVGAWRRWGPAACPAATAHRALALRLWLNLR